MLQKDIFLEKEGDKYFERNRQLDLSPQLQRSLDLIAKNLKPNAKVLEIGCADGRNLNYLKEKFKCVGFGLDPSQSAVDEGKKLFSGINLTVGTAEKLPFKNEEFDLVFFGFCLYLVDRQHLSHAVAEADRVLKNKGYLGITDFDATNPKMRKYRHTEGVYSYKMDYPKLFTVYPHFTTVEKYSYSHSTETFHPDPSERIATTLLYKDVDTGYTKEND